MRRTVHRQAAVLLAVGAVLLAGCSSAVEGEARTAAAVVSVEEFTPSADDPDPSSRIAGVEVQQYRGGQHVLPTQRVAYRFAPPMGGTHDQAWAACNGVVYPQPVRTENLVHSLEHGAVWIAYDPARLDDDAVDALAARVEGRPYTVMSPFPGMERPISLQSWGHRLGVDAADDPRIDQFVAALRQNPNTYPEPGASCAEVGAPYFDQSAPPEFAPAPGAGQVDGTTVVADS